MGICIEFRLQIGKIRTALPRARRIAGLGHEAFDHAMEDDAIVKAAPRPSPHPLDAVGRKIGTQLSTHAPTVGTAQSKHLFKLNRTARRRTPPRTRISVRSLPTTGST